MTESSSMKDWQLEESSEDENQWQLLDTEQELPPELQLDEDAAAQQGWQPVEQTDESSGGSRNWILPFFIILAMVAVVAYVVWLGFSGIDFLPSTGQEVAEAPAAVEEPEVTQVTPAQAAAPVATATPLPEPTATPVPTLPPEPTPALVEQSYATVVSQYGLNARLQPSTEGEPVALLDDGGTYAVVEEGPEWTQIQLEDGTRVWVSSEFVEISTQQVTPDSAVNPPAPDTGSDGSEAAPVTEQASTGIEPPAPFTDIIPDGPAVLVLIDGGVNARTTPDTEATNVIQTIPQGAALPALARSEDGEWVQIEMPNGTPAWIFLEAVDTAGEIESLVLIVEETDSEATEETAPAADTVEPVAEEATEQAPAEEDDGQTAEISDEVATEEATVDDAQITVDSLIGIKARTAPQLDAEAAEVLSRGTTAPATGRTADGAWIQITLTSGEPGWVLVGAVKLNVDPAALPVVEP